MIQQLKKTQRLVKTLKKILLAQTVKKTKWVVSRLVNIELFQVLPGEHEAWRIVLTKNPLKQKAVMLRTGRVLPHVEAIK